MKKKYKALMLDLDGTTIPNRKDAMPSQKVIAAIMKAHKKLFVCVATGRVKTVATPVLDVLKINNPAILLGGSQIIGGNPRRYIYERPFASNDAKKVLELLSDYHSQLLIDEKEDKVDYTPSYKPKGVFNILVKYLSVKEGDEIIDRISHIKTVAAHKIVSWTPGEIVVNISHVLATKQHAIFEVARILGIETHEIIGVGDGYNDFPLLMACGLKVAMGNAVSELKAIADYIAPTVEKDGVADIIEKFVL